MMEKYHQKISFVIVLFLTTTLVGSFTLTPYSGLASTENNNNTLMEPEASEGMSATNTTITTTSANATTTTPSIVLVHGSWVDGSFWRNVIPILQNEGHRVIAAQLPLHSLADDAIAGGMRIVCGLNVNWSLV